MEKSVCVYRAEAQEVRRCELNLDYKLGEEKKNERVCFQRNGCLINDRA